MRKTIVVALLANSAVLSQPANAGPVNVGGFAQAHTAARVGQVDCNAGVKCDVLSAEVRGRLKLDASSDNGKHSVASQLELIHDFAVEDTDAEVYELYWDWTGEKTSSRTGRQVITWGVGDLLFINDIFPKDWNAFFHGLPIDHMKKPSDAIKLNYYPGSFTVEGIVSRFTADTMPESRRYVFGSSLPPLPLQQNKPGSDLDELELAGRVNTNLGGWEVTGYASRTYWRAPSYAMSATSIVSSHPRLNTYGFSLTGPYAQAVVSIEGGFYQSVDDSDGTDPFVENSQARMLLGVSKQVGDDATLGLQWYAERLMDHDQYAAGLPASSYTRPELRQVATARYTQMFRHQTLTLNLFAFIGITEKDSYWIPSVRYAFTDALWGEVGANVFSGKRTGTFGMMGDNDNVYLTLRYAY